MDEDKQNRLFMAGLARELPLALDKKQETELWKALDSAPTMKDVIDMIDTLVDPIIRKQKEVYRTAVVNQKVLNVLAHKLDMTKGEVDEMWNKAQDEFEKEEGSDFDQQSDALRKMLKDKLEKEHDLEEKN